MRPLLSARRLLPVVLNILCPILANSLPIDLMDVGTEKDMAEVVTGANMMRLVVFK